MNEAERSLPYQPLACLGANVVDFTPVGPLVWPDPSGCLVGRFEYADGDTAGTLWLLEHHPAENLVAMNVEVQLEVITYRAGIWEIPSGRLVWEPENTVAMCWSPDGGQIILIRRYYERSPDHPPAILSPLQSEYTSVLEWRTWPEKTLIARCVIQAPTGWFSHAIVSPRGNLAAVVWIEQHCAGYLLVALEERQAHQIQFNAFRTPQNTISGPVFSADGRYLVLTCGSWAASYLTSGQTEIGSVWVYDVDRDVVRKISVEDNLPPGWPFDGRWSGWLSAPEFVTDEEFVVSLPTGSERCFSVS